MSASRRRPKRGRFRRFGLIVLAMTMMPTPVGYQDLAALIARQPAVSERWRQQTYSSTFATFRTATFSFPQPIGTLIPALPGYSFASIDPRSIDVSGSLGRAGREDPFADPSSSIVFPQVDRSRKGDRLGPEKPTPSQAPSPVRDRDKPKDDAKIREALPQQPPPAATPAPQSGSGGKARAWSSLPSHERMAGLEPEAEMSPLQTPSADADKLALAPATQTGDEAEPLRDENGILTDDEPGEPDGSAAAAVPDDNPAVAMAKLYFGADALSPEQGRLKPWREGEAPVLIPLHPSVDPDIKRAALGPVVKEASLDPDTKPEGESVAPKGEVTGADKRPKTPAERLGLSGAARAKHERCLSNAIYFEARGEPERGQMAVAQVVMNRVFSQYYPDNVCGVVYQNAHRHLACQFTFACDNVRDVVTEPDAWALATRISRDTLDGKIWLTEIGKATHYHATYVNPWWVRTMRKHTKLGIHIFYRPKRWGDGADEPSWGPVAEVTGATRNAAKAAADATPKL